MHPMTEDSIEKKIFHAYSLEDAQNCLREYFPITLKSILLVCIVYIRIFFQNILISAIRRIVFKTFTAKSQPNEIAIYTQGILGDHIVVLPALALLRERFPRAEITVIAFCGDQINDLLSASGFVDKVIALDTHPVMRHGLSFRLDKRLSGVTCDLFVDLAPYGNRGWMGSVLREIICAKYLKARFAIGFRVSTWRGPRMLHKIQHLFQVNEPRRPGHVLRELGMSTIEKGDLLPANVQTMEAWKKKLTDHFGVIGSLTVMVPGGNLSVNRWPVERFQRVAVWLEMHRKAQVVILGTASERTLGDVIAAGSQQALNLAGETTVLDIFEILRLAKICVTNDTGTMHAASLIGTPTLAIFGTRQPPHLWFPLGNTTRAIFCMTECSLCHDDGCSEKSCLNSIEDNHVIEAVSQMPLKR
jgi:ADP-heptose:LPS heptosyltransferase